MFAPFIGKKTLEIGCGIGNLTYYLQRLGTLCCLDISDYYIAHMKIDYPHLSFFNLDIAGDHVKMLSKEGFDTVVCVNVLEHINNDERAINNIYSILKPQGRLLLYVPAIPLLYGSVDKNLDHYRRYEKRALEKMLANSGFEIEKIHYSNFIGIFGWFMNARIQKKKELSYWQTILFDKFVPLLRIIEYRYKPPIGMSLIAIAKRNA